LKGRTSIAILLAAIAVLSFVVAPAMADMGDSKPDPLTLDNKKKFGDALFEYGDIWVTWTYNYTTDTYTWTWSPDYNHNGIYNEGWVQKAYSGDLAYETTVEFGTSKGAIVYDKKVEPQTMTWVPGVTVPSGENTYLMKDGDGDGIYEGYFRTPLFWDYVTIQGDPAGPYLIFNDFELTEWTDNNGTVFYGEYIEHQFVKLVVE